MVALHGFAGDGADFAPFVEALDLPCLAPDLPGHGATRGPAEFDLPATLALLDAAYVAWALPSRPVLLGYSQGGRLALRWALADPTRWSGLVLIGATPGLRDPVERAARVAQDHALAERIVAQGVTWFTDWWAERPVIQSQRQIAAPVRATMRERRLANRPAGLAAALRGLGAGALPPCWDALPDLTLPTLLLTGAEDAKFTALARAMQATLGHAEQRTIADAGHCAHLERPAATAASVHAWLRRVHAAVSSTGPRPG